MDERLCTICNALIDLDGPGVRVIAFARRGSKTTVLDVNGVAHILESKAITRRKAGVVNANAVPETTSTADSRA